MDEYWDGWMDRQQERGRDGQTESVEDVFTRSIYFIFPLVS